MESTFGDQSSPVPPRAPITGNLPQGVDGSGQVLSTENGERDNGLDVRLSPEDHKNLNQKLEGLKLVDGPEPQKRGSFVIGTEPHSSLQIKRVKVSDSAPGSNDGFIVQQRQFPPHPDDPRTDEFFDDEFNGIYSIVTRFAEDNFGGFDIKPDETGWKNPWKEINPTPMLISLVEFVEDADPDDLNSWDSLLYDAKKRTRMIVGGIARIYTDKVFDPLLFGCTTNQHDMLKYLEKDMAGNSLLDGFARTATRCKAVRHALDNEVLTKHFYDHVEQLTSNIFNLLAPISDYLQRYLDCHSELDLILPSPLERFEFLFKMVSGAAWLSICRRIHPEPIRIRLSEPGGEFNEDVDECIDIDEYCEKKAGVLKLQFDDLGQKIKKATLEIEQTKRDADVTYAGASVGEAVAPQDGVDVDKKMGYDTRQYQRTEDEVDASHEWPEEFLPDGEIFKARKSLIKTVIWPSIKIYSAVHPEESGDLEGITIYTVQKCQIAAHWAVPRNNRMWTLSLENWVK